MYFPCDYLLYYLKYLHLNFKVTVRKSAKTRLRIAINHHVSASWFGNSQEHNNHEYL